MNIGKIYETVQINKKKYFNSQIRCTKRDEKMQAKRSNSTRYKADKAAIYTHYTVILDCGDTIFSEDEKGNIVIWKSACCNGIFFINEKFILAPGNKTFLHPPEPEDDKYGYFLKKLY